MSHRISPRTIAIAVVAAFAGLVLALGPSVAFAQQGNPPSVECEGMLFLVKFKANGTVDESGPAWDDQVTLTFTQFNEDNEAIAGEWTSTLDISRIVVKIGSIDDGTDFDPPASAGTFGPFEQGISHVTFCYVEPEEPSEPPTEPTEPPTEPTEPPTEPTEPPTEPTEPATEPTEPGEVGGIVEEVDDAVETDVLGEVLTKDEDQLAATGVSLALMGLVGLSTVATGVGALVAERRRR